MTRALTGSCEPTPIRLLASEPQFLRVPHHVPLRDKDSRRLEVTARLTAGKSASCGSKVGESPNAVGIVVTRTRYRSSRKKIKGQNTHLRLRSSAIGAHGGEGDVAAIGGSGGNCGDDGGGDDGNTILSASTNEKGFCQSKRSSCRSGTSSTVSPYRRLNLTWAFLANASHF